MARIAGAKARGHGKTHDLIAQFRHLALQRGQIQRRRLGPGMGMAAIGKDDRIALQRLGQTAALQIAGVKADEDQCNAPTLPLDQGIGGKGRGQRHQ